MANLLFKWGNHASLPASVSANDVGTLFFTKDEGGLYVGTESGKAPRRIQGVVQYYVNLEQFKKETLPPYSEDIIYYIASENALVKWTGDSIGENGTIESGKFTVLNVTASEFNSLSNNVNTLATKIGSATDTTNNNSVWEELESLAGLIDIASRPNGNSSSVWAQLNKLADDIAALSGGSGNSLSALNDKIDAEIKNRGDADTAINNLISGLSSSKADADKVYTKDETDDLLDAKANASSVYTKAEADDLLDAKANASNVYTKTEINTTVEGINNNINTLTTTKANAADVYTKDEADDLLDAKANASNVYTKTEADNLLSAKANASNVYTKDEINTTVEGINNNINTLTNTKADASNVYTKTEANNLLANKANAADVYTKTEVNTELGKKANSADVYTKTEIDGKVTTITNNINTLSNNKADKSDVETELAKKADKTDFAENGAYSTWVKNKITSQLQAAEAMIYMGSISKASDLLTKTDAEAGHTYVLTAIDTAAAGRPGDLFVANQDKPTALSHWDHVKTGYDASLEQHLSADADGIKLTFFDNTVETIAVESVNENITVEVANNKISIGMEWGSF